MTANKIKHRASVAPPRLPNLHKKDQTDRFGSYRILSYTYIPGRDIRHQIIPVSYFRSCHNVPPAATAICEVEDTHHLCKINKLAPPPPLHRRRHHHPPCCCCCCCHACCYCCCYCSGSTAAAAAAAAAAASKRGRLPDFLLPPRSFR